MSIEKGLSLSLDFRSETQAEYFWANPQSSARPQSSANPWASAGPAIFLGLLTLMTLILSLAFGQSWAKTNGFSSNSLTGKWVGSGHAVTHRQARHCDLIVFELEESEDSFHIHFGGYRCEDLVAEYPSSSFVKSSGQLLYAGQEVGHYGPGFIKLQVPEEFYQMQLHLQDGQLTFTETWDDGRSFLKVEGQLKR